MLLALGSAMLWGTSAFLAGLTTKRVPAPAVVCYSQAASVPLLALGLIVWRAPASATDIAWGALAGVGTVLALTSLYHGLSVGRMSIVSPLAALIAVTTPAVVDVVRGAPPTATVVAGLGVAATAIVLVSSTSPSDPSKPSGLLYAVLAGLGFATFLVALDQASPDAGLWPLLGTRLVSAPALALALVATRHTAVPQARAAWPSVVAIGVIDVAGALAYFLATSVTALTPAVALSSLHPLVTVLWARVMLAERLGTRRLAGVAAALCAIVLIVNGDL